MGNYRISDWWCTVQRPLIIIALSTLLIAVGFSGGAVGQSDTIVSDAEVSPGDTVTLQFEPTTGGNEDTTLEITGEVTGWTVESVSPDGSFGLTQPGDPPAELEADDAITTIGVYDDNGKFAVTLSPPNDASDSDSYSFSVEETINGDPVASDSFTIDIVQEDDSEDDAGESGSNNSSSSELDQEVGVDQQAELTFVPDDTGNTLQIEGETEGWTVESLSAEGQFGTTQPEDLPAELGANDSITTIGVYDDNDEFVVTLSPPSDASDSDSYSFTVTETAGDGSEVRSDPFTIDISSTDPVADWVADSEITADQYRAFDTNGDGSLTPDEVSVGVSEFASGDLSSVGDISFTPDEISELVSQFAQNEL